MWDVPFSCSPLCLAHLFSEKCVPGYRSLTSCLGTTPFCQGFGLEGGCPAFPRLPSWPSSPAGIPLAPLQPPPTRGAFTCLSRWGGRFSEQPGPAGGQDPAGAGGPGACGGGAGGRGPRLSGPLRPRAGRRGRRVAGSGRPSRSVAAAAGPLGARAERRSHGVSSPLRLRTAPLPFPPPGLRLLAPRTELPAPPRSPARTSGAWDADVATLERGT